MTASVATGLGVRSTRRAGPDADRSVWRRAGVLVLERAACGRRGRLRAGQSTATSGDDGGAPVSAVGGSCQSALFPAFDPSISDYVIRCTSAPVDVTIGAPAGAAVSVAGQPAASGRFTTSVSRSTGQGFTLVTRRRDGRGRAAPLSASTYYVRCLPTDFPVWTATRTGKTQAQWYVTVPITGTGGYPTIFDNDGVPVWWAPKGMTLYAELLADGDVAWTKSDATPAVEERLDGSLVGTITTSLGPPDQHDLIRLANGDYVMAADVVQTGVDLASAWGPDYPSDASVQDQVIEEPHAGRQGGVVVGTAWTTSRCPKPIRNGATKSATEATTRTTGTQ